MNVKSLFNMCYVELLACVMWSACYVLWCEMLSLLAPSVSLNVCIHCSSQCSTSNGCPHPAFLNQDSIAPEPSRSSPEVFVGEFARPWWGYRRSRSSRRARLCAAPLRTSTKIYWDAAERCVMWLMWSLWKSASWEIFSLCYVKWLVCAMWYV